MEEPTQVRTKSQKRSDPFAAVAAAGGRADLAQTAVQVGVDEARVACTTEDGPRGQTKTTFEKAAAQMRSSECVWKRWRADGV